MITQNMRNLMAIALQSSGTIYGMLPVTDVSGAVRYLSPLFSFPGSCAEAFTLDANSAGISIGTGSTAAAETDYNLQSTITSGITVTLEHNVVRMDGDSPYHEFTFAITNTGSAALTISEIGYKQALRSCNTQGGTSDANTVFLLDRTVLSSPLTIQAGDAGILVYALKTSPPSKTVSGVKIVSFTYGTDEEVAAMIDAARLGTIDLQTDGDWAVGDMRTIHLDAFTGGGSVSHAAQDIDIVITQFGDYMSCGCLFQFDFVESLAAGQRMNSSNTNVGGYGGSEMRGTTIPALVDALPEWLRTRLKTFDVLASAGNKSTTIETVTNNKLALRSEVEIFGTTSYSAAGEGTQIEWYKRGSATRIKRLGRTGSAYSWWERSPRVSNATNFCHVGSGGTASANTASSAYGLSPFGCI